MSDACRDDPTNQELFKRPLKVKFCHVYAKDDSNEWSNEWDKRHGTVRLEAPYSRLSSPN